MSCQKVEDCPKNGGKGYCTKIDSCTSSSYNSPGYCVRQEDKPGWEGFAEADKERIGMGGCVITWGTLGTPSTPVPTTAEAAKAANDAKRKKAAGAALKLAAESVEDGALAPESAIAKLATLAITCYAATGITLML